MNKGAIFGHNKTHRYSLMRQWDSTKPNILFIGLNPSRADEVFNDPTITRCINFAKDWGYGGLYFANLYSFRTPDPVVLRENLNSAYDLFTDNHLKDMISNAERTVVCWGSWKFIDTRVKKVLSMISEPYCFGVNQDGNPKHPLYLKGDRQLIKYIK